MSSRYLKNATSASVVVIFASCCAIGAAYAQETKEASVTAANHLPEPDKAFVQAATLASGTEVAASDFALNKSHNTDVENYAKHMMADHRIMAVKLKAAVPLVDRAPMDNVDPRVIAALKDKQSDDFNRSYIKLVALDGHKEAIAAFEQEAKSGKNGKLRAFAEANLPELREHYKLAQELAKKNGVSE